MQALPEQTVRCDDGRWSWFREIRGLTGVLGAIFLFAVLCNSVRAFSATAPGSHSLTLAWESSPDSEVSGDCIYYGAASGAYSNWVVAGKLTSFTVAGLASGATYFFAITAWDASGQESDFSNEISYTAPEGPATVQIRIAPAGQVVLTVAGPTGHTYDLQATPDFKTWTMIGTVTLGAEGFMEFTDTNAAHDAKCFYRTRDIQP